MNAQASVTGGKGHCKVSHSCIYSEAAAGFAWLNRSQHRSSCCSDAHFLSEGEKRSGFLFCCSVSPSANVSVHEGHSEIWSSFPAAHHLCVMTLVLLRVVQRISHKVSSQCIFCNNTPPRAVLHFSVSQEGTRTWAEVESVRGLVILCTHTVQCSASLCTALGS